MNQFLEAVGIALNAIWTNKLRSFLTVLGNIVAVTSIIAVVSLIQGMNAYVTDAIVSNVGADNFNAVAAQANSSARVAYGEESLDSVQIQGVSRDYVFFSTFNVERGRLINPTEIDRSRPLTVLGWQTAERLFGPADPIDKVITIKGEHFRVVGVSEKKGSVFGQSQDEFAIVPLGEFQKMFGARFGMQLLVKPKSPELVTVAMDEATVAMRIQRRLRPGKPDNFGMLTSDSLLDLYHQATNGIFAVLVGVVALSLVVGGIVIMNIMLMVVTERTREI